MKITIKRTRVHSDYTVGQLTIDGLKICDTLENTATCLPNGEYPITLCRCHQYGRRMMLLKADAPCDQCQQLEFVGNNTTLPCYCPMLKPGNGVHQRPDGSILVGEYQVAGLLTHPKRHFDALYERIRKSVSRGHRVSLLITKVLMVFLFSTVLASCGSQRPVEILREIHNDTIYLTQRAYDSVFVFQDHQADRFRDTIYIKDVQYEYRYKLLRDTVRIVQVDSIPVIREVEVVTTERYVPGIYKFSLWLCVGLIVFVIIYVVL